jgi:hypothetical protein
MMATYDSDRASGTACLNGAAPLSPLEMWSSLLWPSLQVFYEGHGGSSVELALSLALTATLIFAPLTMASIGRRFWLKYKFTDKRIIISNTSPLFKSEVTPGRVPLIQAPPSLPSHAHKVYPFQLLNPIDPHTI